MHVDHAALEARHGGIRDRGERERRSGVHDLVGASERLDRRGCVVDEHGARLQVVEDAELACRAGVGRRAVRVVADDGLRATVALPLHEVVAGLGGGDVADGPAVGVLAGRVARIAVGAHGPGRVRGRRHAPVPHQVRGCRLGHLTGARDRDMDLVGLRRPGDGQDHGCRRGGDQCAHVDQCSLSVARRAASPARVRPRDRTNPFAHVDETGRRCGVFGAPTPFAGSYLRPPMSTH